MSTLTRKGARTVWPGNTAEPSGELSVGDVVAVGEVPLAVGRIGWILVRCGLNEVRASEHGTHSCRARPGEPPGRILSEGAEP